MIFSATVDYQIFCNNLASNFVAPIPPESARLPAPSIDRLRSACSELRAVFANENRHPALPPRETIFTLANLMMLSELLVSGVIEGDEINATMLGRLAVRARRMVETVSDAITNDNGKVDAAKLNRAGVALTTLTVEIERALAVYERKS